MIYLGHKCNGCLERGASCEIVNQVNVSFVTNRRMRNCANCVTPKGRVRGAGLNCFRLRWLLVLAYPMFVLEHRFDVEFAAESGQSPPELRLGVSYLSLLSGVVVWPLVAAVLARFLAVTQNYVRYLIIYNWMTLPAMILVVIPLLVYLATGASSLAQILAPAVFLFLLYVTWYVAKAGLETKVPVAFAFLLADLALAYGLHSVIR